MKRYWRELLTLALCGQVWLLGIRLFFVYSGAQQILADPERQSAKFLDAFMRSEPLPRMATEPWILEKGMFLVGCCAAAALIFLNGKWAAVWWKKGLQFGCLLWAVAIPWFEFYLPYNVMHEPVGLVLLETALWLLTLQTVGFFVSFTLNFRRS